MKIIKISKLFIIALFSLSNIVYSANIYLSIINESIKHVWNVTEFEIKINNPSGVKERIRIKAICSDNRGRTTKEKEKDYEMMRKEDTTQMYISDTDKDNCKTIRLQYKKGNFWEKGEKFFK